ncbi:uncharacterized protein LOC113228005 isoform X2 [Hyposmocoma kahamanoa]|uniref:uncharacterized protein LOC113228005 isoform X2 n=1 Tax=Hyposmocoma kahamanoa TaxID=1477025 RepID=UPI000E6D61E6|nr:uncharacterized protein LOC113228005 isoform X2 [Hyposmocoma kahamanoa]
MASLNYSQSCSTQEGIGFAYNLTEFANATLKDETQSEVAIVGFATAASTLIILFADVLLSLEYKKRGSSSLWTRLLKQLTAKNASRTVVLTLLVLVLPLVLVFLFLALVYKVLCLVVIKRKDEHFVEFLDSFDVFWSLEDDTSKSTINALGVIESDSPVIIANSIKDKLQNIYQSDRIRKIFYRRSQELGFYYWRKYSLVDMNQYVEVIEVPDKRDLQIVDLENLMTELQKQALPYEDEGLFKILITKQTVGKCFKERGDYGIIFRIHHSVGDGAALIQLLCQSFADNSDCCQVNWFSFPDGCSKRDSPGNLIDMMRKLCDIPIRFVDGIIRKPDENLLTMVKEIKDNVENLNFTDVLLTALSKGLRDFFTQKLARVPEEVAVILPIRFPKTLSIKSNTKLKNDFSVTILDVPVQENNFSIIKKRCNLLRSSADPLTNFYFLKLVCSVLPRSILQPLLNSSQATMVFSNLPGPETLRICGGNVLKSLVFFVPHKGNTGLAVTALCYGGVLQFAAMADTALVSSAQDLGLILDGMIDEIHLLHHLYSNK